MRKTMIAALRCGALFSGLADAAGEHFFDTGSAVSADGVDGIHFTADTIRSL